MTSDHLCPFLNQRGVVLSLQIDGDPQRFRNQGSFIWRETDVTRRVLNEEVLAKRLHREVLGNADKLQQLFSAVLTKLLTKTRKPALHGLLNY